MSASFVFILSSGLLGHADKFDEHLLVHFAVGTHPITADTWRDVTGKFVARVEGSPTIVRRGPTDALEFREGQRLVLDPTGDKPSSATPTREISAQAWVNLDAAAPRGSVIGRALDVGGRQQGWMLGYDAERWVFALSSEGADGKRTSLRGTSPIRIGQWQHVAATYDGAVMKLYVDGKLESQSREQSGAILHPKAADYVLGGCYDSADPTSFLGVMFEAKVHDRVLAPAEIQLVAARNQNLVKWTPAAEEQLSFLVAPILQFGTLDSMTIVCETSRPTRVNVQYGLNSLVSSQKSSTDLAAITEVTIGDLKPHTRYFYRVTCTDESGATLKSDLKSFQTAPPADQAWAFAIVGDTQRNPVVTKKCADGAFACRPNFLLHCGDVVDDGFAKNQWLEDLFAPCAELMSQIPTFPVIGNHEKDSHWYYDYFALPKPEYRYTFHYGNAQFFMLDTNRPLKPGTEQYEWLEKELAASKAEWKFACHHHPCFSSDEDDYGDHVKGRAIAGYSYGYPNAKHAIALYEKYGVDIVFNGHIHVYERTWPILNLKVNLKNGVRYITSGGGGGHLETPAPQRTWFSLHVNRAHHFCHVAVFDRTMVFKAYDIEGRLFDTFELTKE